MNTEALAEDIDDDDVDEDQAERTIRLFSLTPAAGAFCLFIGAIAVTMSVCTWENSGAPDAAPVVESRWAVPTVIRNTPNGRISRDHCLHYRVKGNMYQVTIHMRLLCIFIPWTIRYELQYVL